MSKCFFCPRLAKRRGLSVYTGKTPEMRTPYRLLSHFVTAGPDRKPARPILLSDDGLQCLVQLGRLQHYSISAHVCHQQV